MDKVRLSLHAFWLLVPLCSFAQVSGVLRGFNPGNYWGNVQDSVYQRDPVFAHRLDPEASITIDGTVDPARDDQYLYLLIEVLERGDLKPGYHPAGISGSQVFRGKLIVK